MFHGTTFSSTCFPFSSAPLSTVLSCHRAPPLVPLLNHDSTPSSSLLDPATCRARTRPAPLLSRLFPRAKTLQKGKGVASPLAGLSGSGCGRTLQPCWVVWISLGHRQDPEKLLNPPTGDLYAVLWDGLPRSPLDIWVFSLRQEMLLKASRKLCIPENTESKS